MKRKLSIPATPPTSHDSAKRPRASSFTPAPAIEAWLEDVASPPSMASTADDAPPSAPPSLPPSSRRSPRSRSSSPARKWPSDTAYRNQNLRLASVAFTHLDDAPEAVRAVVAAITTSEDTPLPENVVDGFYSKARRLDLTSAVEADWRAALETLLEGLLRAQGWAAELMVVGERDWSPDLKPEPRTVSIPVLVPQKRPVVQPRTTQNPPLPTPTMLTFDLKTPRPDVFVSFSEQALGAETLLFDLQASGNLVSDPTMAVGSRFPYLVVEAKSAATGGSLYQAQNQAAVGGACMLNSLQRLYELSALGIDDAPSTSCACPVSFSISTYSSLIEFWVHFGIPPEDSSKPHAHRMAKFAVFDCALSRERCDEFVRILVAVLGWGLRELKPWCCKKLEMVADRLGR